MCQGENGGSFLLSIICFFISSKNWDVFSHAFFLWSPLHRGDKNNMQQPWGTIKAIYIFTVFFFLCTTKLSPKITAFFSGSRLLTWTKTCVQFSSALPAALLYVTLSLTAALPLLPSNHMVIAKMSIYKRMRRACCFDCGRSERDCSCMSGRVRGNVDTLERAFPLSSVSVNDCSASFRACKFNLNTTVPCLCSSVISALSCVVLCGPVSPLSFCCLLNVVLCVMICCLWYDISVYVMEGLSFTTFSVLLVIVNRTGIWQPAASLPLSCLNKWKGEGE